MQSIAVVAHRPTGPMEGNKLDVQNVGENLREITFNDKKVSLQRRDPHGFWFFSWDSGEPPEKLNQAFTNSSTALEFLTNYINSLPKKKITKE